MEARLPTLPQVQVKKYSRALQPYERLEEEWALFNDLPPEGMVACATGTAALHLAFEALRLPACSEVLVPDFTMVACPRAVTMAGLTPVFVDCDDSLNIDAELVGQHLDWRDGAGNGSVRVGAVLAVHIYGRRCDMDAINLLCLKGGDETLIVEDLAEAHGVRPHTGTDVACWSFYRNKVVAGEEGGAVWFQNPEHARLARSLRCQGFTDAHDFMHLPRGHNYRLSNLHAQPISESLLAYGNNVYARRAMELLYDAACPAEWRMPARDVPWTWDLRIPGLVRAKQASIVDALNQQGVAARMGFFPMSQQQEYKHHRLVGSGKAVKASDEVFYLPLTPGAAPTTAEAVEKVFDTIRQELAK